MPTHSSDAPAYAVSSRKGRKGRRSGASETPNLREIPLFATVEESTLSRLAGDVKVESFEDGDVIFRQGDPVTSVIVVLRGYVKLMRIAPSGDETLIGVRSEGATVGEPPADVDETYRISAEAVGPASILKFPAVRFARLLKDSPALCAAVRADAKEKIAALVTEIESLKAQNADQRLARFILSLCPPGEEQCRFRLPYDKRLIAAQLGVKQETLSRAFAKLRDFGVHTETRDMFVESVARLADQCDHLGRASRLPSERPQSSARNDAA